MAAASSATAAASRCNRRKSLYSAGGQGPAARSRRRHHAVRDRVRARALSVARPVARHVLQPRGVRPRCAGHRRCRPAPAPTRPRAAQRQAACRVRRRHFRSPTRARRRSLALYAGARDPLAGKSVGREARDPQAHQLSRLSDKICGCSEEVANCFQGRPLGFFGLGSDAVPAADARDLGYPGFAGLEAAERRQRRRGASRTSIISPTATRRSRVCWCARSFPASRRAARWRTSCWRRSTTARSTAPRQPVSAFGLQSTCVDVAQRRRRQVQIAYVRGGTLHRVEARHAVLACFHMMIPHIMPELPAPQRAALAQNVKTPICLHQRAGAQLAARSRTSRSIDISAPMSFHHQVSLDFPVSLGGYRHPRDPSEPMLLHLVHVAGRAEPGARRARPVPHRPGQAATR